MRGQHVTLARNSSEGGDFRYNSCYEPNRDALLSFLDRNCFKPLIAIWMLLVVVDGAFFFFVMVGAHNITPEEKAKEALNWSIQGLNWLFSISAIYTMPWRWANLVHLTCTSRSNKVGLDFYGNPTTQVWFHIPFCHRWIILLLLLSNCVAQYINQIIRLIYFDHLAAEAWPGVLLVNLFFALSFLAGIGAGMYQGWAEKKVRKTVLHVSFDPDPMGEAFAAVTRIVSSRRIPEAEKDDTGTTHIHQADRPSYSSNGQQAQQNSVSNPSSTPNDFTISM